ncbi:hypothetical protein ACFQL0_12065 [Haloplanus litoreus]|uniref:hypothetical protein n=1 Tax=Haloplanus litoreus TaxID=767515 RepID=UPI0036223205
MHLPEPGVVAVFAVVLLPFWALLSTIPRLRELVRWPTNVGVIAVQSLLYRVIMLLTAGTGTVTGSDAVGIVGGVLAVTLLLPSVTALPHSESFPRAAIRPVTD